MGKYCKPRQTAQLPRGQEILPKSSRSHNRLSHFSFQKTESCSTAIQTVAISTQFSPQFLQFEVNYSKVNGAERMPVGWVMMSKYLALPGQQLGSRDTSEVTGLHLVPGNELMQLSISALMSMEITRAPTETRHRWWGGCTQQEESAIGTACWVSTGAGFMVLSFLQVFTQRCFPWFKTPALHTQDRPCCPSAEVSPSAASGSSPGKL